MTDKEYSITAFNTNPLYLCNNTTLFPYQAGIYSDPISTGTFYFPTRFDYPPIVIIQPINNANNDQLYAFSVHSVTTESFSFVKMYKNTNTPVELVTDPFYWIAINGQAIYANNLIFDYGLETTLSYSGTTTFRQGGFLANPVVVTQAISSDTDILYDIMPREVTSTSFGWFKTRIYQQSQVNTAQNVSFYWIAFTSSPIATLSSSIQVGTLSGSATGTYTYSQPLVTGGIVITSISASNDTNNLMLYGNKIINYTAESSTFNFSYSKKHTNKTGDPGVESGGILYFISLKKT